ncbi:MAG: oligosaccharide flippase family protein [Syntrophaceae bacterium]|nr:oligosaccharide flippase family protein [Syntrophaceae bacterium]
MLTMLVSLFTVRIVLNALGVVDYGIYSVVAGIVSMFGFLSGTMASASQRFFAFEIGKNNQLKLKQTFGVTVTIYAIISLVTLLATETIGLWFLNHKMVIPPDRLEAARWVYHFSILSFIMTIMTIPYQAVIIAREKMSVYAYVSIIEVLLKLLIVYLLLLFSFDKLKLYAVLMFCVTAIVAFIYRIYCKRRFKEATFGFSRDKKMFREILSYSGWNMIGSISVVLKNQGVDILLNIFFNPAVNAARGIAFQINAMLMNFTNNFYTAVRPQITKSYANGDLDYMRKLVFRSSKFAFFLMLLLSIPLLLETHYILKLWLKEVPEYAVIFARLVIINSLIEVLSLPLVAAIQATGRIKLYQTTVTFILLLNLPMSYLFLKIGYLPEITMVISIVISLLSFIPRLIIFQITTKIMLLTCLTEVYQKVIIVGPLSFVVPFIINTQLRESFFRVFMVGLSVLVLSSFIIIMIGLTKQERNYIIIYFKNRLKFKCINNI